MSKKLLIDEVIKGHPVHEDFGMIYVRIYFNEDGGYPFTVGWSNTGRENEIAHGHWTLRDAVKFADEKIANWNSPVTTRTTS